jgi:hypothetical protein
MGGPDCADTRASRVCAGNTRAMRLLLLLERPQGKPDKRHCFPKRLPELPCKSERMRPILRKRICARRTFYKLRAVLFDQRSVQREHAQRSWPERLLLQLALAGLHAGRYS